MSLYYAKGSSYALDLINNDKYHFANEYQATQPISQSLAYIANTLLSKEKLFGIHGTQIEKQKKESIISEDDRANTISQFKKGEISYQETFLGGCTTTTPCQHRAMRSITACLNCDKSIIKKSKLERVIKAQTSMLKNLDPTSLEYRTERSDLKTLKNVLVNIQKKSSIS
ncbi:hypothetical protein WH96_20540 [Kiloniella spongiae]|uniref:Uncharacterized protein n=2 Tax=Kiloniella spongiae TaxID=1489064 RepID=A0A0H2MQG1_9PROT|nr:hypothetical protein WH96_20540 [Kiloniella spongiae]